MSSIPPASAASMASASSAVAAASSSLSSSSGLSTPLPRFPGPTPSAALAISVSAARSTALHLLEERMWPAPLYYGSRTLHFCRSCWPWIWRLAAVCGLVYGARLLYLRRRRLARQKNVERSYQLFGNQVRFGLDIGGTLCKVVYFEPELTLTPAQSALRARVSSFVRRSKEYGVTGRRDHELEVACSPIRGNLHFLKFQTAMMPNFVTIVRENALSPQRPLKEGGGSDEIGSEPMPMGPGASGSNGSSRHTPHHVHAPHGSLLLPNNSNSTLGRSYSAAWRSEEEFRQSYLHALPAQPQMSATPVSDAVSHTAGFPSPDKLSLLQGRGSAAADAANEQSTASTQDSASAAVSPASAASSTASAPSAAAAAPETASSAVIHPRPPPPPFPRATTTGSSSGESSASCPSSPLHGSGRPSRVPLMQQAAAAAFPSSAADLHSTLLNAATSASSTASAAASSSSSSSASAGRPLAPILPLSTPSHAHRRASAAAAGSASAAAAAAAASSVPSPVAAASAASAAPSPSSVPAPPSVCATGGGAFKFEQLFRDELHITLHKEDELHALVKGIDFMIHTCADECYYLSSYRFKEPITTALYESRLIQYPYLVVNIGSGVSILKVSGPSTFERVGGTSLGGGTFYGLCRALTGCTSFEEALALAERGRSATADLLVGDIYGGSYEELGLPAETVAASFGKLVRGDALRDANKEDLAKAALVMITNNIGSLANLYARKVLNVPQMIFVGNFLNGNDVARRGLAFATEYWSQGAARALFLKHEGYFGAVGSLLGGGTGGK